MSFYKTLYTNIGGNKSGGDSKPTEAQKRLSDALDASKVKKPGRALPGASQIRVEKITRKALKNPQYYELLERAKKSGKPGAQMLSALIATYGSIDQIPNTKLKQQLLRKLNASEENKND